MTGRPIMPPARRGTRGTPRWPMLTALLVTLAGVAALGAGVVLMRERRAAVPAPAIPGIGAARESLPAGRPAAAAPRPSAPPALDSTPSRSTTPTTAAPDSARARTADALGPRPATPEPPPRRPAPAAQASPAPRAAGRYGLQLGAFADRGHAEALAARAKGVGFPVRVVPPSGAPAVYRVRVEGFADGAAARRAADSFRSRLGITSVIVPPGR